MTKEEILSLYKQAYKEASDMSVKTAAFTLEDATRNQFSLPDPASGNIPQDPNPVPGVSYRRVGPPDSESVPSEVYQDLNPVPGVSYRRVGPPEPAYTPSEAYQYSPVDYARQALAQVYGQNHLNSLSDDAYVMRKWRAAMQGRNAARLQDAYRKAYLGYNGMVASQGANYGGDKAKNYGIYGHGGMPVQRPQMMAGPRFQNNRAGALTEGQYNTIQYWKNFQNQRSEAFRNQANQQAKRMNDAPPASQQAAQPPKPQNTTTSTIPNDLRKEVIGSLGNNTMTA